MLDRAHWHDALPPGDPAGSQAKHISLFSVLFHCFCWFLLCMTKLFNSKKFPPTHPHFFLPPTDRQLVTSCFSNDEKHVDISLQSLVVALSDGSQASPFQRWWIFILAARSQTNCLPPSDPLCHPALPPTPFPPFFPPRLFSCLFLAIFRGFTLEPAYETRLIFHHCLIMTTTSRFTLLSSALFPIFILFFFCDCLISLHGIIMTSKMHPYFKYENVYIWALMALKHSLFTVCLNLIKLKFAVLLQFYWLVLKTNFPLVFQIFFQDVLTLLPAVSSLFIWDSCKGQ